MAWSVIQSVAFLVVFIFFTVMMIWSYIMVRPPTHTHFSKFDKIFPPGRIHTTRFRQRCKPSIFTLLFIPPSSSHHTILPSSYLFSHSNQPQYASPSGPPAPLLPGPAPPSFSALSAPPSTVNTGQYVDPNVEETIGIPYENMSTVGEWTDGQGDRTGAQMDEVNGNGTREGVGRGMSASGREKLGMMIGAMKGNGNGHAPSSAPSPPEVDWEDDGYASDGFEPEREYDLHQQAHDPQRPAAAVVRTPPAGERTQPTTNGTAHRERRGSRTRGERDAEPAVIDDGLFRITGKGHALPSSASSRDRPSDSRRHTSDRHRRRDSHDQGTGHHAQHGRADTGRETSGANGRLYEESEVEKGWRKEDLTRKPSNVAVLLPEYRYCRRCSIVRPPRAHHCRACATVSGCFNR